MIKKTFLLLVVSFAFVSASSQKNADRYLSDYIKVWGFLKYYHPTMAGGRVDADAVFLKYVGEVRKSNSDKSYKNILTRLVAQLGSLPSVVPVNADTVKLFKSNDRTGWIERDQLLPVSVKKQLLHLRSRGYTDSVHHYMPATFFATEIPAEKKYDSIRYPDPDFQLLALARYWNAIEYLFAYKYMLTRSWQVILDEQVPAFARPLTQEQFERHLLQLNAAIEDSHGGIVAIKRSGDIYGAYFPPFTFRFAGDSIVIIDYIDSLSCLQQDLRKGDIVTGIRNKTIAQALADCANYVSASNSQKKKSLLASIPLLLPFRGTDSVIKIDLLRNGMQLTKQVKLQKPSASEFVNNLNRLYRKQTGNGSTTQNDFVLRSIDKDIAWVDGANLSILYNNTPDDRAIDSVIDKMRQHKKAILLDLRSYATQAVFYNKFLPGLGRKLKQFAVLLAPYNRYPGNYYPVDIFSPVRQAPLLTSYTGKIILLVSEQTQSQSELMTMILQASGAVTVIGTQTAGCDGDLINMPVPGGYELNFSGRHVAYPDGTASQKAGVKRDIRIDYSTKAIAEGRDEILEAALLQLR